MFFLFSHSSKDHPCHHLLPGVWYPNGVAVYPHPLWALLAERLLWKHMNRWLNKGRHARPHSKHSVCIFNSFNPCNNSVRLGLLSLFCKWDKWGTGGWSAMNEVPFGGRSRGRFQTRVIWCREATPWPRRTLVGVVQLKVQTPNMKG